MIRPALLREPPLLLLAFSAGLALTVLLPPAQPDPVHARAIASIWPVMLIGGIAAARFLRVGPGLEGTGWLGWWVAGLLAYLVHLAFAWVAVFGWSVGAAAAAQGLPTTIANFALLLLWAASAIAASIPKEPRWEQALHAIATLLFIVTTLVSALVFAGHPVTRLLGLGLLALWLHALWRRMR